MSIHLPFRFRAADRLADYARIYPDAAVIFTGLGLSLGAGPLDAACAAGGLDGERVRFDLALAVSMRSEALQEDWGAWAIDELIDHIEQTHHLLCRAESGRLRCLLEHSAAECPRSNAPALSAAFRHLEDLLIDHLEQEEFRFFPGCRQLERQPYERPWPTQTFLRELRAMEHGHEDIDAAFQTFFDAVDDMQWPDGWDPVRQRIMEAARTLVDDLVLHSYKEHEYLLPAVTHAEELLDQRREAWRRKSEG